MKFNQVQVYYNNVLYNLADILLICLGNTQTLPQGFIIKLTVAMCSGHIQGQ